MSELRHREQQRRQDRLTKQRASRRLRVLLSWLVVLTALLVAFAW